MTDIFLVLSGFLFGLAFLGGYYLYTIPVGIICLVLGWLNRPKGSVQRRVTEKFENLVRSQQGQGGAVPADQTRMNVDDPDAASEPVDHNYRNTIRKEVEADINSTLQAGLVMLQKLMPEVQSICIFFPAGRSGTMQLRSWVSSSEDIVPKCMIRNGQGLVGQILKTEITRILEGDISDSTPLYYYQSPQSVRSIAAVPITIRQVRSGAVLIDSRKPSAFDGSTIEMLRNFATLIGHMSYASYLSFQVRSDREQLRSLYHYQAKFFSTNSVKHIYEHIQQSVKHSVPYQRLMILALSVKDNNKGRIVCCSGNDEEYFLNLEFSLNDKGLLLLPFQKKMSLNRNFAAEDYVFRINDREKVTKGFRSLLAVPVSFQGVSGDQSRVAMVICVESIEPSKYSSVQEDMLSGIASAAGFALERTQAYEEKQELASRDGLTGLINHRTFQERLRIEKLRADRMRQSLGLLMMDIDHFKSVNDHYGHPVGDKVLRETSKIISREVRSEIDIVARYGGEEFVVLLIDSSEDSLRDTAERIRAAIEARDFDIGRVDPLKATISIGYYLLSPENRDVKKALELADEALYSAKKGGRNRAVRYQ